MIGKIFNDKYIAPAQNEAIVKVIDEIEKKFISIRLKNVLLYLFVLLSLLILPLIFSVKTAIIFSVLILWSVLIYGFYHLYKSSHDIYHFLSVRSLDKFIYQKIYEEVKKEMEEVLNQNNKLKNILFETLGDGKSLLIHKISSRAHEISRKIIITKTIEIIVISLTYFLIRNYLLQGDYHLSVIEIMLYPIKALF